MDYQKVNYENEISFSCNVACTGVTACSTVEKVVYRIDVPQGNYLEQDKIAQLKVGMTAEQVEYLLGTPMLKNIFETHRWIMCLLNVKVIKILNNAICLFILMLKVSIKN
ncbi:Small protein A precursor [Mannheimia haemolytica]|uniref:Outer membrane protein assembly factor BamE n=1 Tax=Mannheimia haemolytica TaxID=75985 RepID=A0A378N8U3_MANHA|nr:Small protein A precursor [Mannheimia haemolytica]